MLLAVVTEGSFTGAAERLQVSQPAISYAIAKMEEQLGMRLLRLEGRKAQLTESGHALLERAHSLLQQAAALESMAETIRQRVRPQLRLAIEHGFPVCRILPGLRDFMESTRHARVNLMEISRESLEKELHAHAIELAIATGIPHGFTGELLLETEHVAVAHPAHPLHRLNRDLCFDDLEREVQVVTEQDEPSDNRHAAFRGLLWKVNSMETAEAVVLEGLGFAWLPSQRVQGLLRTKKLLPLPLAEGQVRKVRFYLVWSRSIASEAARLSLALKCVASDSHQLMQQAVAISVSHAHRTAHAG